MQKTKIYEISEAKYKPSDGKTKNLSNETVVAYNLSDAVGKYLTQAGLNSDVSVSGKLELKIELIGAQG